MTTQDCECSRCGAEIESEPPIKFGFFVLTKDLCPACIEIVVPEFSRRVVIDDAAVEKEGTL